MKLPNELLKSLQGLEGFSEKEFVEAHTTIAPTTIRKNPFKLSNQDQGSLKQIPWSTNAYYLPNRPVFTVDPLFHAGCYYVQEASSMFIEHVVKHTVNLEESIKVLDLCASPGGKSTLLNSLISEDSLLIANDVIKNRSNTLAYNLTKWGTQNTIVTNSNPENFQVLNQFFDVILIDAPCSGSGLFRKQPDAINEWSINNINVCGARQKQILIDTLPTLKPNGILIYSTCSYSSEENENISDWILEQFDLENLPIPTPLGWGIVETESTKQKAKGYRFYPHLVNGEGFFCSVFQKTSDNNFKEKTVSTKTKQEKISAKEQQIINHFISIKENSQVLKQKEIVRVSNNQAHTFFINYQKDFYFRKVGVYIGDLLKEDLIPHHELALSIQNNENNISTHEVTLTEAIKFLKKEAINPIPKKGWCLITYNQFGIGWVKALPNRTNNYLPKEYRIINQNLLIDP